MLTEGHRHALCFCSDTFISSCMDSLHSHHMEPANMHVKPHSTVNLFLSTFSLLKPPQLRLSVSWQLTGLFVKGPLKVIEIIT